MSKLSFVLDLLTLVLLHKQFHFNVKKKKIYHHIYSCQT